MQYHKQTKLTSTTLPKRSHSEQTDHFTPIFCSKHPDTPDDLLCEFFENLCDDGVGSGIFEKRHYGMQWFIFTSILGPKQCNHVCQISTIGIFCFLPDDKCLTMRHRKCSKMIYIETS